MSVVEYVGRVIIGKQATSGQGFVLDQSQLDQGSFGDVWQEEIAGRLLELSVDRGWSPAEVVRFSRAGTIEAVLDNSDGALEVSPVPAAGTIQPGSPIVAACARWVDRGTLTSMSYEPVAVGRIETITRETDQAGNELLVIAAATDERIAADLEVAEGAAEGAGETADERIPALVAKLKPIDSTFATGTATYAAGTNTMPATTYGATVAALIEDAAEAEDAVVFVDREGAWRMLVGAPGAAVMTLGDAVGAEAPLIGRRLDVDRDTVRNDIRVTRDHASAVEQTAEDASSVAAGRSTYTVTGVQVETDAQALTVAESIRDRRAEALKVSGLEVFADRSTTSLAVAQLELGDRISLDMDFAAGTELVDIEVTAVSHRWKTGEPWVTTLEGLKITAL